MGAKYHTRSILMLPYNKSQGNIIVGLLMRREGTYCLFIQLQQNKNSLKI